MLITEQARSEGTASNGVERAADRERWLSRPQRTLERKGVASGALVSYLGDR